MRLRHYFAMLASAAAMLTNAASAHADTYPSKPVRFIIPFAAGGPTDLIGRLVAQKLQEGLKQPFVPENKPGAGGNLGTDQIVRATADGYTVGLSTIGPLAINPTLYAKLPYDPQRDLSPVILVARAPSVLAVHPSVPAKTVKELVKLLTAAPDKYNYASGGVGSTQHLAGELFAQRAGVKMTHIAYKGEGPATTDLVGGQVTIMFMSPITSMQYIRAGKLRAVAVTSTERMKQLPDVPTIAESGYPGFETTAWFGLVAPAGTPDPIVRRLNEVLAAALRTPEVTEKLNALGAQPGGGTPTDFGDLVRKEIPRWGEAIKRVGVRADQ
jgi:tripartite-type tricarboxylate transporter receptor subunit TctC